MELNEFSEENVDEEDKYSPNYIEGEESSESEEDSESDLDLRTSESEDERMDEEIGNEEKGYPFPMRWTTEQLEQHAAYCEANPPSFSITDKAMDEEYDVPHLSTDHIRFNKQSIPYLRKQKLDSDYADKNEYLDILARLEHEEFERPIREMLQHYRATKAAPEKRNGIRIAEVTFFRGSAYKPPEVGQVMKRPMRYTTLAFEFKRKDFKTLGETDELEKEPFIYGQTILISSHDFFNKPIVGVIGGDVWKVTDNPKRPSGKQLVLQDEEPWRGKKTRKIIADSTKVYSIMEPATAYFQPIRYTLKTLLRMANSDKDWPQQFEEYLLRRAAYKTPWRKFESACIDPKIGHIYMFDKPFEFNAKLHECMMNDTELAADVSQRKALYAALSSTLTLVQGPPGTGKTYLSVAYIMALFSLLSQMDVNRPIIVSSMKNLTLDQMMERVIKKLESVGVGIKPEELLCRLGQQVTKEELFDKYNAIGENKYRFKKARIIFVTSTGILIHRHRLLERNPIALVMDEAAELTESETVTCFLPSLEQIVLVGDHQQLQPRPNVPDHEHFNMHCSLFERLYRNGFDMQVLAVQHRMNTNIVNCIVRPYFYKTLESHESVQSYPAPLGMKTNLFLWNSMEDSLNSLGSQLNGEEGIRVLALTRYLLHVDGGYQPEDITVITMYKAQRSFIRRQFARLDIRVRVETVDSFQGKENKIIIVSIVRSNQPSIGFLKLINRSIVALTRAQHAMYVIGNFKFLSEHSNDWKEIWDSAGAAGFAGDELPLVCRKHNYEMKVTHPREIFVNTKSSKSECMCVLIEKPTQPTERSHNLYFHHRFNNRAYEVQANVPFVAGAVEAEAPPQAGSSMRQQWNRVHPAMFKPTFVYVPVPVKPLSRHEKNIRHNLIKAGLCPEFANCHYPKWHRCSLMLNHASPHSNASTCDECIKKQQQEEEEKAKKTKSFEEKEAEILENIRKVKAVRARLAELQAKKKEMEAQGKGQAESSAAATEVEPIEGISKLDLDD